MAAATAPCLRGEAEGLGVGLAVLTPLTAPLGVDVALGVGVAVALGVGVAVVVGVGVGVAPPVPVNVAVTEIVAPLP